MASTERVLALGPEHLAGCLALSASANWNQNEADWRLMLQLGRGWGLALGDEMRGGTLAASTILLPYCAFAWVSMVLVLPAHRGRGYATTLLDVALAESEKHHLTLVLDATPAGHEVYAQQGFRDTWGFRRYALAREPARAEPVAGVSVRPLREADWPQLLALDASAFGASREPL
ncbi:MAG: GNAT family N-acetyltransferase, partial [Burkholderiales bacterium]